MPAEAGPSISTVAELLVASNLARLCDALRDGPPLAELRSLNRLAVLSKLKELGVRLTSLQRDGSR